MATSDPFALPAFILSIVSLAVAAVGAATGIVALVWQIITRTRGAHRVKVKTQQSWLFIAGVTRGPYLSVVAVNKGLSAVEVTGWGVEVPGGGRLSLIQADDYAPYVSLPHRLDPGAGVTFFAIQAGIAEHEVAGDSGKLRAVVDLATGEKIKSKRGSIRF